MNCCLYYQSLIAVSCYEVIGKNHYYTEFAREKKIYPWKRKPVNKLTVNIYDYKIKETQIIQCNIIQNTKYKIQLSS